ncbi:MAG: DUF262 domain-containing protein [Sphaerochaetaceae bacterium]|nr:DUF262 domain-containing protein [Sphaerochaetaceae bacterium]
MYSNKSESIKTFIDSPVRLPRFQRKLTWKDKENFQLCISLFKEYPIGVCILSEVNERGRQIRMLLDGRQRRHALTTMYRDPEQIYLWARAFIGIKNNWQPDQIKEKFWEKINEYIEADPDSDTQQSGSQISELENEELFETPNVEISTSSVETQDNLGFLLDIILSFHNIQNGNTNFTKPFNFSPFAENLPYVESQNGNNVKLSSLKVNTFIKEYWNYCQNNYCEWDNSELFLDYLKTRTHNLNEDRAKLYLRGKWEDIRRNMLIVEKLETIMTNAEIGYILIKDISPADGQKIFNIINTEGQKLKAVEILSAKPKWNEAITDPSSDAKEAVKKLYEKIGSGPVSGVVRWDIPASLFLRLDRNFIFKHFDYSQNADFEKAITCGFKVFAGIFDDGVKSENIENLCTKLNWNTQSEPFIYDLKNMLATISSLNYFRYFSEWGSSIMELTSDSIAQNFIITAYRDWSRKGKPQGADSQTKIFKKNCFILWDSMIYQYVNQVWRGSADAKIANNIKDMKNGVIPDRFSAVTTEEWKNLLTMIKDESKIKASDISFATMKPLLYHMYCMKGLKHPSIDCEIDVDHIIPQEVFKNAASLDRNNIIQDNLFNLGLLPKRDNISKSNKKLIQITDPWLRDMIETYEFISKDDYEKFSDINNYKELFEYRSEVFFEAYTTGRNSILNN